jgi:hypothetical protein
MSYYFVNNKYPVSDPNIDLNFNNDILYHHIVGDDAVIDPKPYDNADQKPRRSRNPDRSDIRQDPPTYNILLSFILIAILVVITFYLTQSKAETMKPSIGGGIAARHLIMPGTRIRV